MPRTSLRAHHFSHDQAASAVTFTSDEMPCRSCRPSGNGKGRRSSSDPIFITEVGFHIRSVDFDAHAYPIRSTERTSLARCASFRTRRPMTPLSGP